MGHIYRNAHIFNALQEHFHHFVDRHTFCVHPFIDGFSEIGQGRIMFLIVRIWEVKEKLFDDYLITILIHKREETKVMVTVSMGEYPRGDDRLLKWRICFQTRKQVIGTLLLSIADINDDLAAITSEVRPHAEAMVDTPTEFELITAIALAYFARQNCDVIVFEVGMGGRLDSTNIIDAKTVALSIITGIALDHTDFLGDTPKKIAAEKAGIIKAGVPIVFGGMHPAVGETKISPDAAICASAIRKRAAARGARYIQADHSRLTVHHSGIFGSDFDFDGREDLHVSLAGLYQPYNAATVLTAVDVLLTRGFDISKEAIRAGLAHVSWPGRFEVLCNKPLVIADGGHNPEGIDAAVASMAAYFEDQKIYLLTGVMADKDYAHMIARMKTVASRAFCVRPQNSRALEPERYAAAFQAAGVPAEAFESVEAGVHTAMAAAREDNAALVCLGSLYMYGDVRAAVLAESQNEL